MVIVFINQSDADIFITYEFMRAAHPRKASAYNDHMFVPIQDQFFPLQLTLEKYVGMRIFHADE